jgi:hypothetical protein
MLFIFIVVWKLYLFLMEIDLRGFNPVVFLVVLLMLLAGLFNALHVLLAVYK